MSKKKFFTKRRNKSFRQYLVILILFVSMYQATTYMFEYKQSLELLAKAHNVMKQKAQPLPSKINNTEDYKYRRLTMAGSYDYDREFLIEVSNGYELIVPFKRASGAVIMVNRGYVSQDSAKYITRPKNMIKIEGIMGLINAYSKENAAVIINVAEQAGVKEYSPFIISLVENNFDNYPVGAKVKIEVNNKLHLAIILYSYSLFILVLMFLRQKRFIRVDF